MKADTKKSTAVAMTWQERKEAQDLAHPLGYKGDLRKADGSRGAFQWGGHWSIGQLDELHCPPKRHPHDGEDYRMAIGTMALNNGMFFAHNARTVRIDGSDRGGGTAYYARQFPSREAARRANAAFVLWLARARLRYIPPEVCRGWKYDEAFYRQIVAWVYEVLGQPTPALYVAPPPPPPVTTGPDCDGQMGFVL